MKNLRRRLSFANVVSCLALFVALGGTSYAAFKLPKNSVGTKQLKNGAVSGAKIAKGAVTASSIAPGTIARSIDPATLGTVPSATDAGHSATADTASSAATLQGLTASQITGAAKLHCPAGTSPVGELCFDASARPVASYSTALRTCGLAGMELPTDGQLALLFVTDKILMQFGWTAGHAYNGGFEASVLFGEEDGSLNFGTDSVSSAHSYWCVTTPRN